MRLWAAAVYGLVGYYAPRIIEDDYKSLAATLHAYQQPGDAVVLYTDKDWPVFAYHHPGEWVKVPHALHVTPQEAQSYLWPIWESHDGVWLVTTPYAGMNDPLGHVPAWLGERATAVTEHPFGDKVLRFYARTPERAAEIDTLSAQVASTALDLDLGSGVRLAAYEQAVPVYRLGDTLHLFLHWAGGAGQAVRVSLVDGDGRTAAEQLASVPETLETRQRIDLRIPPDASPGQYSLVVGRAANCQPARFGRVTVRPWSVGAIDAASVDIAHPLDTDFGDGVRLLGFDLKDETVAPGGFASLTLYWQAREPVEQRYKVFTHLIGEVYNAGSESFLWGQKDNEPAAGAQPTTTWRPGSVVIDRYEIALDEDAPEGEYSIEIGLYHPTTGERLAVLDAQGQPVGDHLILNHIKTTKYELQ